MPFLRLVPALAGVILLSACGESPSDVAFGAKVREYLLRHPEVMLEVADKLEEKQTAEAADKTRKALVTHRQAIERDPRDFVANPGGKVTVTEFFDYNCGYCKVAGPDIVKLISDNPDVRFVFKEYPIFGGDSDKAARAALAVRQKGGKYLDLYNDFLAGSKLTVAEIDRRLIENGFDPAAIHAAGAADATGRHLSDVAALAQALGIEGTPAFIVGDTMVPGADMRALQAAIDKVRKAA